MFIFLVPHKMFLLILFVMMTLSSYLTIKYRIFSVIQFWSEMPTMIAQELKDVQTRVDQVRQRREPDEQDEVEVIQPYGDNNH
jgi:hypothetical protein